MPARLSLAPLKALFPRSGSRAGPARTAEATEHAVDERSLEGKSKNPHLDTDDEASLQNVAEAAEHDPDLNPGGLSFEEGKSRFLAHSQDQMLTESLQTLQEERAVISGCSVARCSCAFSERRIYAVEN